MAHHFDIILRSFFLGMCTFLAISKQVKAAVGLGSAVLVLQIITVPLNNLILSYILKPGAFAWAGFGDIDLFLQSNNIIQCLVIICTRLIQAYFKGARVNFK